jgi:hypothetical protein
MSLNCGRAARRLLQVLGLLLPVSVAVSGTLPSYTVRVSPDLERLEVVACSLAKPGEPAADLARRVDGPRTRVGIAAPDICAHDTVRLDNLGSGSGSWRDPVRRLPGAVLVSPDLWLWHPDQGSGEVQVLFDLPPGIQVSVPWEPVATAGGKASFRTGRRPRDWESRVLLGRFDTARLEVPGATLEVAMVVGDPPIEQDRILEWIRRSAEAVTLVYGTFPVRGLQVLVVPIDQRGEPVPWGQVMRGGGDAVHLYIDQTQPYEAFLDDWVLVHEMSHLLHPFMHRNGRWLYEGIASYYQNVLRARAGLLSAQEAWNDLHAGFRRGLKGTKPHQSLAQASEAMMKDRAFMRVYWSGAAIALLADLELRRQSSGRQSLDTALAALGRCCLPSERLWTDLEVMQRLDAVTGTRVFTGLYHRYRNSEEFPDLNDAYRRLGLYPISDTEVRLQDDPQAIALRDKLMRGG